MTKQISMQNNHKKSTDIPNIPDPPNTQLAYKQNTKKKKHKCTVCNKKFIPYRSDSKYCTKKCKQLSYRKTQKPTKCVNCKKRFVPRANDNKYCSSKCRTVHYEKNKPRTCKYCKKKFIPRQYNQKFCSILHKERKALQDRMDDHAKRIKQKVYLKRWQAKPENKEKMRQWSKKYRKNLKLVYNREADAHTKTLEQTLGDELNIPVQFNRTQNIKKRICLMCDRSFTSQSISNRRCPQCQTVSERIGSFADMHRHTCTAPGKKY